jgi:Na+-translocating ferredoxin:NAD+ oxidoreductase subunit G
MKQSIRMILTLVTIASLSGAILAGVYEVTKPKIELEQRMRLEEAIFAVVPETTSYKEEDHETIKIYRCFDKDDNFSGLAFAVRGIGYQGIIKIMVGLNSDLSEITGIKVLEDQETPGLGGRINEAWWQDQFKGRATEIKLELIKRKPEREEQIQAITGATISSEAVVDSVNKEVEKIKKTLNLK